jgi:VanZ family protein
MKRFFIYHFPALVYAILILVLSSIPRSEMPDISILQADKFLHFLEYAVLGVLIFRSVAELYGPKYTKSIFWVSFLFVIVFACFDEIYQSYVPGRESDILDILLDIAGATVILYFLWRRRNKTAQKIV